MPVTVPVLVVDSVIQPAVPPVAVAVPLVEPVIAALPVRGYFPLAFVPTETELIVAEPVPLIPVPVTDPIEPAGIVNSISLSTYLPAVSKTYLPACDAF